MLNKARLIDKTFICICNESTCLEDMIDDSGYGFSSTIAEEIICEKCGREYKVRIDTSVIVEVDDYRITEVSVELYQDKNGNDILPSLFEGLALDEEVPHLYDGKYEVNEYLYEIVNGRLAYIFSNAIDPNQMSLFNNDET